MREEGRIPPVASCNWLSPAVRKYIDHGTAGLLSLLENDKGPAENIRLLLENESLRVQLAQRFNDSVTRRS